MESSAVFVWITHFGFFHSAGYSSSVVSNAESVSCFYSSLVYGL